MKNPIAIAMCENPVPCFHARHGNTYGSSLGLAFKLTRQFLFYFSFKKIDSFLKNLNYANFHDLL
jgi:hypothetical protein